MVQVKVKQGLLEGGKKQSILNGKEFYYFSGIPYATPPIGDLRFRPPVPANSWEGVRSALEEGKPCLQGEFFNPDHIFGCEDCLYLNVYTPETPNPDGPLKAVMVYIHGGGFMAGAGSNMIVGPDYLISRDIIVVTFNYRLHILGFLNLNIPNCSGNYGLKDQSLALRWVKENIQSFGGDPNNITVFGESAGAASTHFQMISPMSKGLFNRAILQSGNVLAPWAITTTPEKYGFQVARKLGYEGENLEQLAEFLRKQPIDRLYVATRQTIDAKKQECPHDCQGLAFCPSVEKIKENALIPDYPENLIKLAEPMPVICGVDEIEGVIVLFCLKNVKFVEDVIENIEDCIKVNLPFCEPTKVPELAAKIREFYFGGIPLEENKQSNSPEDVFGGLHGEKLRKFLDLFSDLFFLTMYDSVDYIIKSKHPAYFYEFTFSGELNQSKKWPFPATGTNHADELGYLFYAPKLFPEPDFSGPEKNVIDHFSTLWTNFSKTGNPTPDPAQVGVEWKPHTEENPAYLDLGYNLKCVEENIWNSRRNFWKDALKKFTRFVKK